jgi:hypothetical protein
VRKVLAVDTVHLRKVGHVGEEDVDFDDALDANASLREDGLDVVNAGLGLIGDGTRDEVSLLVRGDAARDVDVGAGDDGMRLSLALVSLHVLLG